MRGQDEIQGDRGRNTADERSAAVQSLSSLNRCLRVSTFRADRSGGPLSSDLEDLFEPGAYLALFTAAYAQRLSGRIVTADDLPPGDRIVDRLERWLSAQEMAEGTPRLDRYLVAAQMATHPGFDPGNETAERFAALFRAVNAL